LVSAKAIVLQDITTWSSHMSVPIYHTTWLCGPGEYNLKTEKWHRTSKGHVLNS
jgi:hypothetical protein